MNTTFSNNLKRLRLAKNYTQEQVAEYLRINAQTVSRWECGTTLPDVMLLPEIARLYCVTIDDLYKESSSVYENYAQRLASVYEASGKLEDFVRVDAEYKKMLENGPLAPEDMRTYGVMYHFMMQDCIKKALELFDSVLEQKDQASEKTYWKTRYQKASLLSQIGKSSQVITEQLDRIEKFPEAEREWALLVSAYMHDAQYEKAYQTALTGLEKFPESWDLVLHAGDCCRILKKYEEAFGYWDKALLIDPTFYDAKYSKAFTYEELGEYEKAYHVWCDIIDCLKKDGFEIEAQSWVAAAQKCREKIR